MRGTVIVLVVGIICMTILGISEAFLQGNNPIALSAKYAGPTPAPDNQIVETNIVHDVILYWHRDGSFTVEFEGKRRFYPKGENKE